MASSVLLSPGVRAKEKQETVSDFLLGGAAGGRLVFNFESLGQVAPMMWASKKFSAYIISFIDRMKRIQVTIINAAKISKPVCFLRVSFVDVST